MKIIGLTGGIGSGKTTVANMFLDLGIPVYIADTEAKKLTNSSKLIMRELTQLLGNDAYSQGVLNTKYVADKIFNDKTLLEAVNSLIHPVVEAHFKTWVANQTGPYVIKEAAILFENGTFRNFDKIILITAPEKLRIARIKAREKSTISEIMQRMDNQWSDERKAKLADFVIENIDLDITRKKIEQLDQLLR